MTVVRRWEAKVARSDLSDWVATYRERVLPNVREIDGFESVTFLASREGDPAPVTVLMRWRDMDAIKSFAGEDPAKTVLPDFMARFLPDYDARATFHDELLLETK
ncbi:MAG: hypothetical protein AB3N13_10740 [Arenibacterium sp.]